MLKGEKCQSSACGTVVSPGFSGRGQAQRRAEQTASESAAGGE
jgi:hypothetical protein